MAAGLGFKTFSTGDVLSAADVNGYLMQGILVFASAAARDAAITSPEEGQFAFLKDTNVTTYYTGSAWANVDTTGMTNPMTTTGDVIYSSSGSTPARLGIGTAGQVLQVNSGATAPEWATPAAAATLLSTTTVSGTATTVSGISGSYNHLRIYFTDITANGTTTLSFQVNGIGSGYYGFHAAQASLTAVNGAATATIGAMGTAGKGNYQLELPNYAVATNMRPVRFFGANDQTGDVAWGQWNNVTSSAAITSFTLTTTAGTATLTGTIKIYGVTA
jgi:hypothetical protein